MCEEICCKIGLSEDKSDMNFSTSIEKYGKPGVSLMIDGRLIHVAHVIAVF